MVRDMWRYCLCFFCSALMFSTASATELHLELTQKNIELGQTLQGKLIAIDSTIALSDLDLKALQNDFVVITHTGALNDNELQRYPQENVQVLELELYPRHSGVLTIPPINLGQAQSRVQTITVNPAMESGSTIDVHMQISDHQVWQRQQIVINVEVKSPQAFFTLETESFKLPGFEIVPLKTQKQSLHGDAHYRTRVTMGWALFPLIAGDYTVDPPMIGYRLGGRIQRRFPLSRIEIRVRQLPAYIPPNMPVAKVNIRSSVTPTGMLKTDTLSYWTVTLTAQGTLPYWLPPVLNKIQNTAGIEFLPAQTKRSEQLGKAGVFAKVVHQIPFKARHSGNVPLPILNVQYFDPSSGRIESLNYHPTQPLAMSTMVLTLLLLCMSAAVIWTIRVLFRHSNVYLHRRRLIRHAMNKISQADTAVDIIIGLRHYATAQGWSTNLSVADFVSIWRQHYHLTDSMLEALHAISYSAYSGRRSTPSLMDLRQTIFQQLRAPRRIKRHFTW